MRVRSSSIVSSAPWVSSDSVCVRANATFLTYGLNADVFALQIGVLSQKFLNRMAGADLSNYHSDSDTHPPNAGFTTHHRGVVSDAIKGSHKHL